MTIPVLIAPVINRIDMLERMLRSIDHVVEDLLVVDNGQLRPDIKGVAFDRVHVVTPPETGMGYGGAINFGLTQFAGRPWWMWSSNDVVFDGQYLRDLADEMNRTKRPLVVTGGFTWGVINRAAVQKIGLIDEWSFHPIYFDDNDYYYRGWLAGVEWRESFNGWHHGDGDAPGSMTIRSDKKLRDVNHKTFEMNKAAYIAKWGGLPGEEQYTTPWNEGGPVWTVKPDIDGRAQRRW